MNQNIVSAIQIVLSILLVLLILLQSKGAGLGSTFGGDMGLYRTRRGVEKGLFYLSIIVSGLFIITSLIRIVL